MISPTRPTSPAGRGGKLARKLTILIALGVLGTQLPGVARAADLGESSGEITGGADGEKPKGDKGYKLQATDPDAPKDPAVVAAKKKAEAEAALQKSQPQDTGPSVYQKWQFWALTGAVVVAVVGIIIGGSFVLHSMSGGDVQQCIPNVVCSGEGRQKP
jgi:hypothetical protein